MRIVTGGINHETSTFTPVKTTWRSYEERFGYLKGQAMLDKFRRTNTPIGGFIEGAAAHGFDLVPTVFAHAYPSAPTPRPIFDVILGDLLDGIARAGRIDGVLLELHGAMVAEGIDDAEGHILAAVRHLVGPTTPIVAQLDIHSNMSPRMVELADVLIGRETYPEIDMAERGRECADVMVRIVREGLRPMMALHQIPMTWGMNQVTAHSPMRDAIAELHRIEAQPGVVCGSISTGFRLSDVPDMGASVFIVTDNDLALAQRYADELGRWIYERRALWHSPLLSTREALALYRDGPFPVVLADRDDNTGGGAPGDSTGQLRAFIEAGLEDACILYIVDPEAVRQAAAAGVGATLALDVGGKSHPWQGEPVRMTAKVMALSDGAFRYDGPRFAGLDGDMGPSAYIKQGGIHVVLVTMRSQPTDTAFARSLGLDLPHMRYIGVKSAAHFRAAFEPWAGVIGVVAEHSVHNPPGGALVFRPRARPLYPFDLA